MEQDVYKSVEHRTTVLNAKIDVLGVLVKWLDDCGDTINDDDFEKLKAGVDTLYSYARVTANAFDKIGAPS